LTIRHRLFAGATASDDRQHGLEHVDPDSEFNHQDQPALKVLHHDVQIVVGELHHNGKR
jgi:hypothetical protein